MGQPPAILRVPPGHQASRNHGRALLIHSTSGDDAGWIFVEDWEGLAAPQGPRVVAWYSILRFRAPSVRLLYKTSRFLSSMSTLPFVRVPCFLFPPAPYLQSTSLGPPSSLAFSKHILNFRHHGRQSHPSTHNSRAIAAISRHRETVSLLNRSAPRTPHAPQNRLPSHGAPMDPLHARVHGPHQPRQRSRPWYPSGASPHR